MNNKLFLGILIVLLALLAMSLTDPEFENELDKLVFGGSNSNPTIGNDNNNDNSEAPDISDSVAVAPSNVAIAYSDSNASGDVRNDMSSSVGVANANTVLH